MRYELTDFEWATIRSFLPNEPRGIPRVDDRRVLNGVFLALAPYLYGAQLDRTVLQQDQAMSACCDPIRQSSRPTIWLSSNSHQFEFGCVLPGPRLSNGRGFEVVEALFAPCAPSRHHETYWWARPRFSQRAPNCFASRASAISIQECDKTTRRANQSKVCPALRAKIFRLTRRATQRYLLAPSHPIGGAGRDRHERAVRCGGRDMRGRRARMKRTAKSCGPDAAVLASSRREVSRR